MGSALGVEKAAARRIGATHEQYQARMVGGERWCTGCKEWHPISHFSNDCTRGCGLSAQCLKTKRQRPRGRRVPEHDRARYVVNLAVRYCRLPAANSLPCADCGHLWTEGERRHEYDHYKGYSPEHQLTVQAVCTTCHAGREKGRRNG